MWQLSKVKFLFILPAQCMLVDKVWLLPVGSMLFRHCRILQYKAEGKITSTSHLDNQTKWKTHYIVNHIVKSE